MQHDPQWPSRRGARPLAVGDGLIEIGEDVADILDADGESDQLGGHAGAGLLLDGKLLVRGGRGMDDQRLGIADIGQQRKQLERVDELLARLRSRP